MTKTSKPTKVEFSKEFSTDHGTLYGFNVEMENGDKGLYNSKSKDNPKFKVGEPIEYEVEEKTSKSGTKYNKLKPAQKSFGGGGGGYKARPSYSIALEMARKMYNSSFNTPSPWDFETLIKTADYLLKQLTNGIDRDSLETAVTIQCARAMGKYGEQGDVIDSKKMIEHINELETWIKSKK